MAERPLIVNATAIGRRADGIATYGTHLVKALWRAGIGHRLTVVLNEDARRFFADEEIPAGASIQWVSGRMSPSLGTRGNMRRWLFANRLNRRHRAALVFALSQLEAPIVGGRGIVTIHDTIPLLFRDTHPRQYHFYRHYLGRAARRAAAVITPSQKTRDDVCRHFGLDSARVHVIPHGSPVPTSSWDRAGTDPDRFVLWIGRSVPTKNLPVLLAAFRILEGWTDVRLIIAGEGPQVDLAAAGAGDLSPRVTMLGSISETEKIRLLDRASVLVCPSLYEGFGFAPLEAMARGCPVVAARTGALPEVCGDAAVYVDPRRPVDVAEALFRVLTRADLACDLARRGRARASLLTWDASVQAHLAVIDRVAHLDLNDHPARASRREDRLEADVLP